MRIKKKYFPNRKKKKLLITVDIKRSVRVCVPQVGRKGEGEPQVKIL